MARITTETALRALYNDPVERAVKKELDHLDSHCRRFISLSPLCVIGSTDAEGHADTSPRGGAPGFAHILDDKTLALPDSPGNNRLDTLSNIVANPEVALFFLIPGVDETLRVNGTAAIDDDAELCAGFAVNGRAPRTIMLVTVRVAFLHCAKALMRARLWDPAAQIARSTLPTMGQMMKDHAQMDGPAETQADMLKRYAKELY